MKIALFGGSGMIGSRILREALARGHEVTVVARDLNKLKLDPKVHVIGGDVFDPASVTAATLGQDAVISAVGPGHHGDPRDVVKAARSLTAGLGPAGVKRLLVVGGAGGLEVEPGMELADTPTFPAAWKGIADAHRDALPVYRASNLDWTYFSPAAFIQPGERTGRFRTGTDKLIADEKAESRISAEDYAVAMLEELEHPRHLRGRMTAAY